MKIYIKSRKEIEAICNSDTSFQNSAVISISDYGCDFALLKYKPYFLLQLNFDDVDNDVLLDEAGGNPTLEQIKQIEEKYHMFSDELAKRIATFYFSVSSDVDVLICQCEYGQSRSAAVAAAIMEYENKNGINIFADDKYYPNKVVFRKALKALHERK